MGLRMTVNSALSISLSLMFFLLVACALVFLAGAVRLAREGSKGKGPTWMAYSLATAVVFLAATPFLRPVLGQWDNADGSYVQVTVNNGLVTGKSQFGLSQ